jgi:hypothetical protein
MTVDDAPAFRDAMGTLNLAYPRQQLTSETQVLYFERLARFSIVEVQRAIATAIDRGGDFPPSIARLIELIEGAPEDRAALAWARAYHAALRGYGTYHPLDFGDETLHAAVAAMGGWGMLYTLGHRDAESVDATVARKQFMQLYAIYLRRGVPESTPKALCADPDRVGRLPAVTLDALGEYPKRLLALPEPTFQPEGEILAAPPAQWRAMVRELAARKALPPPVQPVAKPIYTQAEIDEQEQRKAAKIAEARAWLESQA